VITVRPGDQPAELVPGDAESAESVAARLSRFATAAAQASSRVRGLDAEHWSGEAAELFRAAVAEVPAQLARAGEAFAQAARALRTYAQVLREAQATAGRAVRMVEGSTPESAEADGAEAGRLVERARADVAEAGRAAAARLAEASADAPAGVAIGATGAARAGGMPRLQTGELTVSAVSGYQLSDPDALVAPLDGVVDEVRFGEDHPAAFAGAGEAGAEAGWAEWAEQRPDRATGEVGPGDLAALGTAAAAAAVLAVSRRRGRTALARLGVDEQGLRRRRDRYVPRHRDGDPAPATPATPARAGGAGQVWRTRLASAPRAGATVHAWSGPEADPRSGATAAPSVSLGTSEHEVRGAVQRTGEPADERHRGTGAAR
jgi:hypothetical protein